MVGVDEGSTVISMKSKIANAFFCAVLSCITRNYIAPDVVAYFALLDIIDLVSIDKEKKNRANKIKALCSFMVGFANHKKMAIGMETYLEERILQRLEMLFEIDLDTIPRCLDKARIYLNGLTSDKLYSFVYPVANWNGIIF